MPDVTARIASVSMAVAKLRADLPAIEWRAGQVLAQLAELAAIVGELAAGAAETTTQPRPVIRTAANGDRRKELQRLAYLACRSLPPNLDPNVRDTEIARILGKWGVTANEITELGYQA